jgi:hypothetical protein
MLLLSGRHGQYQQSGDVRMPDWRSLERQYKGVIHRSTVVTEIETSI